jgi:hypothetical protein
LVKYAHRIIELKDGVVSKEYITGGKKWIR